MLLACLLSAVCLVAAVQAAFPNEQIAGFCASLVLPPSHLGGAPGHCPRDDSPVPDESIMSSILDQTADAAPAPTGAAEPMAPLCHNWMAPFFYDTVDTAKRSIYNRSTALGRDYGVHYASAIDDSHKKLATGFFDRTPPVGDVLYAIDTVSQIKSKSSGKLNKCLSSLSVVTIPQYPGGWHVALTARTNASFTGVYNVDVATAAIDPKVFQVQWQADPTGTHKQLTVARAFFELSEQQGNVAYLLQPCNLAFPQQLARVDLTTEQVTTTTLQTPENFCVHAPALIFGTVYALGTFGTLGQKEQLLSINPDDGSVNTIGEAPAGFTMSRCANADISMELTPYTYSFATNSLYAMSGDQTKLARFNLISGAAEIQPWTTPNQCRKGKEIHSFAGILA